MYTILTDKSDLSWYDLSWYPNSLAYTDEPCRIL